MPRYYLRFRGGAAKVSKYVERDDILLTRALSFDTF